MHVTGEIFFESFIKLGVMVMSITILLKSMMDGAKSMDRISLFNGLIVDGKFFRHYECKECKNRVNVMKDNVCKHCGAELFAKKISI